MSEAVQFTWGVLLPILAFGDEVLDVWFLISNWDQFVYPWLRWACFGHLFILFFIEFIYGYMSFKTTSYGQSQSLRLTWGLLSLVNLNEAYMYFTTKKCCSSQGCGGESRNRKFEQQCKEILNINAYIHMFGEDLPQLVFQIMHQASYQQRNNINLKKYSDSQENVWNFVSIVFSAFFLALGTMYFCCLRCFCICFSFNNCTCDCEFNLFDCLFGRWIENKNEAVQNEEQSMNQIKF